MQDDIKSKMSTSLISFVNTEDPQLKQYGGFKSLLNRKALEPYFKSNKSGDFDRSSNNNKSDLNHKSDTNNKSSYVRVPDSCNDSNPGMGTD